MIKKNLATECGVTNGAEAKVIGWKAKPVDEHNHQVLETVFVELTSPPDQIQLEGLPVNVVPITRQGIDITCTMPNGKLIKIWRSQVPIIPNFAMTDYNSQGRTRKYNVCDLQNCRSHQSVYTCLSRGSTYEGTVIVQGFDSSKITGGISGYLRQEFRDLEILDEVTRLQFIRKLPKHIGDITRNQVIYSYRDWKGVEYIPKHMPKELKWTDNAEWLSTEPEDDFEWEVVKADKFKKNKQVKASMQPSTGLFTPAKGTTALATLSNETGNSKKRKINAQDTKIQDTKCVKKPKVQLTSNTPDSMQWGFTWSDNSCGYDALFMILYSIYAKQSTFWNTHIANQNDLLAEFTSLFTMVDNNELSRDDARQFLREELCKVNKSLFPIPNNKGLDIFDLSEYFLQEEENYCYRQYTCTHCNNSMQYKAGSNIISNQLVISCNANTWRSRTSYEGNASYRSTTEWFNAYSTKKSQRKCNTCNNVLVNELVFTTLPTFLMFRIEKVNVQWQQGIVVGNTKYRLCGLIYHGRFHFTARAITPNGSIWCNDGLAQGQSCDYEGRLRNISPENLTSMPNRRTLLAALYVQY